MTDTYHGDQRWVTLLEQCRALRQSSTDAEALLWRLLRRSQVAGAKFRRQHQHGHYILDFYCHARRLCIEVDGGQHASPSRAARDQERTAHLNKLGIRVLRFTNGEVLQETEAVVRQVWEALTLPSPKGRG